VKQRLKFFWFVFLAAFLIPFLTRAQSNYKPGYVVDLKGDTIKGFIDYQEWDRNPDTIKFKKTLDGEKALYGVNDISFFDVDGVDDYKKLTVSISNAEVNPEKLEYAKDTTFRTSAIFLRVLQQGKKVAMYSYKDNIKDRYYIGTAPDFVPKELIFQTYLNRNYEDAHDYQTSRTITENTFQRQLNQAALSLNELTDQLIHYIHTLEYKEDDMLKIASKLNHIDKASYERSRYKRQPYQWLVGAGVTFTNSEPSGVREGNITLPTISGGISLFPNPNTRRLQFRFELVLNDGTYKYGTSYNILETSFVPQVIYNLYNGQDFKFFAGGGLSGDLYHYSDISQKASGSSGSFVAKTGAQLGRHIAIQFVFIQNTSDVNYYQIGINYLFK
jgi:hypothetical protein